VHSGAHPYLWTDKSETYTEAILAAQLVKVRLSCAPLLLTHSVDYLLLALQSATLRLGYLYNSLTCIASRFVVG
jgi:hypothetical protein